MSVEPASQTASGIGDGLELLDSRGSPDYFAEMVGSLQRAVFALGGLVDEITQQLSSSNPPPHTAKAFDQVLDDISEWIQTIAPQGRDRSFFDPTTEDPDYKYVAFRAMNLRAWVMGRLANEIRLPALDLET